MIVGSVSASCSSTHPDQTHNIFKYEFVVLSESHLENKMTIFVSVAESDPIKFVVGSPAFLVASSREFHPT